MYTPVWITGKDMSRAVVVTYLVVVAELLAPVDPAVGEDDNVPVSQFHCLSHTVGVTTRKVNS